MSTPSIATELRQIAATLNLQGRAVIPNVLVIRSLAEGIHYLAEQVEREANTKLISAAPELLEALQCVMDWWMTTTGFEEGGEADEMPSEVFNAAQVAIRKAKGTA